MAMKHPLGGKSIIQLKLSSKTTINTDLNRELTINLDNLREDLLSQPSKCALWSTATKVIEKGVDSQQLELNKGKGNRGSKQAQYYMVYMIGDAFSHKTSALKELMRGKDPEKVIENYYDNLSGLRALLKN